MSVKLSIYNQYQRIITYPDEKKELVREPMPDWQVNEDDWFYMVKKADTLRGIAYKQYKGFTNKGHRLWWVLADVNGIEDTTDITDLAGEEILIPNPRNLKIDF